MTRPAFLEGLSEDEEGKVAQLAQEVFHLIAESQPLQAFCTRSCYVRYLRARSWNVHKAAKMLEETLKWRASYKPEALTWRELEHEATKERMYLLPKPDRDGRPVVVMRPKEDPNPNDNETRLKWLVYTLEMASQLADSTPDGKMTWLIDYTDYTRKASPPLKVSLATLQILQSHYPERLGRAVCHKPPMVFDLLWKAVWPFIDPVTYNKVVFITKKSPVGAMLDYFYPDGLDTGLGGSLSLEECFQWGQYTARMQQYEEGVRSTGGPAAEGQVVGAAAAAAAAAAGGGGGGGGGTAATVASGAAPGFAG